jgi:hypothetical protein
MFTAKFGIKIHFMTNPANESLDVEGAAEFLGMPAGTLRYWRHQGRGPKSFKYGRRVFYKTSDLDAWAEAQYRNAIGDDTPKAS